MEVSEITFSGYISMKKIIAVIGSLGVGKSTLVEEIKKRFPEAIYLNEPVNQWLSIRDQKTGENLLDRFYHNQTRWTYTFENMAFITRLTLLMEALNRTDAGSDVIVIDGSLATDQNVYAQMLYDQGHMDSLEWQAYHLWSQFCDNVIRQHTIQYIYLRCDPTVVMERVVSRHREGEQDLNLEYLQRLQAYLEKWVNHPDLIDRISIFDFSCDLKSLEYQQTLDRITQIIS